MISRFSTFSFVPMWGQKIKSLLTPVPSDIEISQMHEGDVLPIPELATKQIGLLDEEMIPYGKTMAKVDYKKVLDRLGDQPDGNYVLISGINPTPFGEGKSTTAIGLTQALGAHLGYNAFTCLRQPSMGPTFGIKGGAAGGGYSQIVPMTDFNLHMTGDIHAVSAANNLMAAAIDVRIFHEKQNTDQKLFDRMVPKIKGKRQPFHPFQIKRLVKLGIAPKDATPETFTPDMLLEMDKKAPKGKSPLREFARLDIQPSTINWKRVVDINDRFLREITVGQAPTELGMTRKTGFDIAVASEVMAILALSSSLADMRDRLGNIVFAEDSKGRPITAEDLGVAGAMTVLMKDAIHPTMMQTVEGTPCFVHAGPFANIAHGNSSIIADKVALKLVGKEGFVLTEAGFGADIGMEKFYDIKCRNSGLVPNCAVIVVSIRALKHHGGCQKTEFDEYHRNPSEKLAAKHMDYLKKGVENMRRHIENANKYGVPAVICINQFSFDSQEEVEFVRQKALEFGAFDCQQSNHWAEGGKGAQELGKAVVRACKSKKNFKYLYDIKKSNDSENLIKKNIEKIAKSIYGAKDVEFSDLAKQKMERFTKMGLDKFPICMAKTQYSLSHDPKLLCSPKGFTFPIRDIRLYAGAGLIVPLVGTMQTIPGLGTNPAFFLIDIDPKTEKIVGLS